MTSGVLQNVLYNLTYDQRKLPERTGQVSLSKCTCVMVQRGRDFLFGTQIPFALETFQGNFLGPKKLTNFPSAQIEGQKGIQVIKCTIKDREDVNCVQKVCPSPLKGGQGQGGYFGGSFFTLFCFTCVNGSCFLTNFFSFHNFWWNPLSMDHWSSHEALRERERESCP